MGRLVYHDQSGRERTVDIGPQRARVTVGRNADCVIQTNNASVSREHAVLVFRNGSFVIQDPPPGPPTNGTYVNGRRLRAGEVADINVGDEIKCGNFIIMLTADELQVVQPHGGTGPTPAHNGWSPPAQQTHQGGGGWSQQPQAYAAPAVAPTDNYGPQSTYASQVAYAAPVNDEELERLRRENVSLGAVEQRQREQIEQLQHDLLDKERLLADMERRTAHHDNVVEGLNDKIAKLKEQVDLQKDQLREYREELKSRNDQTEDIEFKLSTLQNAMTNNDAASASAETHIADLKVQINQRDRRIDDLQREIDLTQYALTTERDNVERLEMTLTQINSQSDGYDQYRKDMHKVVEHHEATIADLRRKIEEMELDNRRLNDQLRNAGGAAEADALRVDIDRLRAQVLQRDDEVKLLDEQLRQAERSSGRGGGGDSDALKHQVAELEAELEAARAGGGDGGGRRDLVRQLNDLKRENRDLRMAAGEGGAGGGAADPALRRRVAELEEELESALRRLRDASRGDSGGAPSGMAGAVREKARGVYQSINDIVSQWRDDLQTLETYFLDLERLFEALKRIDINSLPTVDRVRLQGIMSEVNPAVTISEINNLLASNQSAAGSIKGHLRDLREVVQ